MLCLCSLFVLGFILGAVADVQRQQQETKTISLPIQKQSRKIRHQRSAFRKRDGHPAKLYNDEGSEYLITVGIGTPPQNFTVALDTGSADLWVPSTDCATQSCPLARFERQNSSTISDTGETFAITYGIGSANGSYVRDTVSVGNISAPAQQFGLAANTDSIIAPGIDLNALLFQQQQQKDQQHVPEDDHMQLLANGILGLGFPDLVSSRTEQKQGYDPFVFRLAQLGLIEQPVFSIYMGSIYDRGWAGTLLLGGTDPRFYEGDTLYAPVIPLPNATNNTYWMVQGRAISLRAENRTVLLDETLNRGFVMDTGTTLTYLDRDLAERLVMAAVENKDHVALDEASGIFIVHCGTAQSTQQLELVLDNLRITLPVRDLVIPLDADTPEEATQCMFGFAPWLSSTDSKQLDQKKEHIVLVGDTVLRSLYLTFDIGQTRIGFAKARGADASLTPVD
ncbi:aspartic peptidase domain-containing protein [Syncephalastrum racemosum]|uniref:Aspartic peptidase domain-containing protein n=1 Tax=Syncephalastrum racemosum TaxID=13706 RepID=A0A1X2HI26_SYNRA|nr:aspartic peptidase domain-containing protein [Syncephalastrum racemosum]